ncbi:MAG TPA: hypothetical protein VGI20_02105 [Rhizomicrobium sp.]|jgi:hypothetical protein
MPFEHDMFCVAPVEIVTAACATATECKTAAQTKIATSLPGPRHVVPLQIALAIGYSNRFI